MIDATGIYREPGQPYCEEFREGDGWRAALVVMPATGERLYRMRSPSGAFSTIESPAHEYGNLHSFIESCLDDPERIHLPANSSERRLYRPQQPTYPIYEGDPYSHAVGVFILAAPIIVIGYFFWKWMGWM